MCEWGGCRQGGEGVQMGGEGGEGVQMGGEGVQMGGEGYRMECYGSNWKDRTMWTEVVLKERHCYCN